MRRFLRTLWCAGTAVAAVACGSTEMGDLPEGGEAIDARFDRSGDTTATTDRSTSDGSARDTTASADAPSGSSDGSDASVDVSNGDTSTGGSGGSGGGTAGASGSGGSAGNGGFAGTGGSGGGAGTGGFAGASGSGGGAGTGGFAGTAGVGGAGTGGDGPSDGSSDFGPGGASTGGAAGADGATLPDSTDDVGVGASPDAIDGAGGSDAGADVSSEGATDVSTGASADVSAEGAADAAPPGDAAGGGGGDGVAEGGGDAVSLIAVSICPKRTVLLAGESMAFTADVTGTANGSVFYGIVGGTSGGGSDSGSVDRGTIAADGLYTSPATPGSYDIVVKSQQDTSKTDTATVTVVAGNTVPTVRGTITAPPGTGRIFVVVNEYQGGATTLVSPGPYVIRGLAIEPAFTNITVVAYRDVVGVGTYLSSVDPIGQTTVSWNGSNATGVDITLVDPPAPSLSQAPTIGAWPMDSGAMIKWDQLKDIGGNEVPQYYRLYASTTPNPGPDGGASLVKTVRAGVVNAALMAPLANGTAFYFAASAVTGTTESPLSSVVGPITIGAPTGGHTISGTVSFGFAAQGSLHVWAYAGNKGIWSQKITNPVSPQSFTIGGVPDGRYDMLALFDLDDDGEIDPDEPGTFRRQEATPVVAVAGGNVTNVPLSVPNTDGMTWAVTQYRHEDFKTPDYEVHVSATANRQRVVKAVLIAGPGVVPPIDMRAHQNNVYQWEQNTAQVPPSPGGTYDFEVTYENGKTCNLSAAITGVWTSLPTALQPSGADAGSATPTFTWLSPSIAPPTFWYRLNMWDVGSSSGDIWWTGLPSSYGSVVYNDDGRSSASALISGKQYAWVISATDPNGNIAAHKISFGVP